MPEPARMDWTPEQYLRFVDQRMRPALELLERVPLAAPRLVIDLGCGTGAMSRIMAALWPDARVVSVDRSREMLSRARAEPGGARVGRRGHRGLAPRRAARPDLLERRAPLDRRSRDAVPTPRAVCGAGRFPGGADAAQLGFALAPPDARDARQWGEGGAPLGDGALRATVGRKPVADAATYHDLLAPRVMRLDIWETEYLQILEGEDPVLEWVKGTGLRPVLGGLVGEARERFMVEYRRRLQEAYPRRADGTTLYPFRRLFIVAGVGDVAS